MSDFYEESEGNYWEKIKQKKALFYFPFKNVLFCYEEILAKVS